MAPTKRMNLRKISKGGEAFSSQKIIQQILDLKTGHEIDESKKKMQYDLPKMRGGVKGRLDLF